MTSDRIPWWGWTLAAIVGGIALTLAALFPDAGRMLP